MWATKYTFEHFVGNNVQIQEIKKVAYRVAKTSATILITGESGTGKEILAQSIHSESARKRKPFVSINCASIPKDLLESELFGYESGSFTGAKDGGKAGKFEMADGGSILLDEIGDMPLDMQVKVLRVLQESEIIRIGGTKPKNINFRIISCTNRNIDELVCEGKFRRDLFYRLDVVRINIPPLRQRKDDIPLLVQHFLKMFKQKYEIPSIAIPPNDMSSLEKYNWPGNVRELRNVMEKIVIFADSSQLIPTLGYTTLNLKESKVKIKESVEAIEKTKIIEALKKANYNKQKAAKLLGIHRSGLYQKLKKYNI